MNPIEFARDSALFYRSLGYNALPSRKDVKGPALASYADYWETPLPDAVYADWGVPNVQLMTGTYWRLCVVDCDGPEAIGVFLKMRHHHGAIGMLPTWAVRTGSGGHHYYFTLPSWIDECPSRRLWGLWDTWAGTGKNPGSAMKGDWAKHQEVRLLGDKSLVIAPPSIHVTTAEAYQFLPDQAPANYPRPMEAPGWLLAMPAIINPATVGPKPQARPLAPARPPTVDGIHYDRRAVLAAIPDKVGLARSWGLRFSGTTPGSKGWYAVHAFDRDDATASASFHPEHGVYSEKREGITLGFFDLAVALNQFRDWREAVNHLGATYCPAPRR